MFQRRKAKVALACALLLLLVSGVAGWYMLDRFWLSAKWVIHSYEVRDALGGIDSAILQAGRARNGYVITGNKNYRSQFESSIPEVGRKLIRLRELTSDNAEQQEYCTGLEAATFRRLYLLRASVQSRAEAPQDQRAQAAYDWQSVSVVSEIAAIMEQMRHEEQRLLDIRMKALRRRFVLAIVTLAISSLLALLLFTVHYRLLFAELEAREQAERLILAREASLRRLTVSLLQLQDTERRKFSRELHDGLAQYLVAIKMNLEMFMGQRKESLLAEAIQLLDQSMAEARTLSHLLHPPLLDEAGLASAVKWYVEEFARRSGIDVAIDLPDDVGFLSKPVALGIFRMLQESMTNIHRHSKSSKAEVSLRRQNDLIILTVRDYGKGIAPELLANLRTKGTNLGVGLAGMRERARDLGGELEIQACSPGTLISVAMPISEPADGMQLPTAG